MQSQTMIAARRPVVLLSSHLLPFPQQTGKFNLCDNTKFDYGLESSALTIRVSCSMGHYNYDYRIEASHLKNIITGNNSRSYFIHMTFKNPNQNDVYKWFRVDVRNGGCETNIDKSIVVSSSAVNVYVYSPFLEQSSTNFQQKHNSKVLITMVMMHHEDQSRPQPSSSEARLAKLFNLKGQLCSEIIFNCPFFAGASATKAVAINVAILRDCSPVFNEIFNSSKKLQGWPKELTIPYVSHEALELFYNWIYGAHSGVWLNCVKLNHELLEFAEDYLIPELIQICVGNLINTPNDKYTIKLAIETGKFGEKYGIPELEDRTFEWVKWKSGNKVSADGCLPWKE